MFGPWDKPSKMDDNHLPELPPGSVIFGKSLLMSELEGKMRRVLGTNLPVLLQGESGTGKRTLSRFIHKHSKGIAGQYVRVNCAADSGTCLEYCLSTLVGNERKTNSDPLQGKVDSIGTLFLEDLAELSPKSQMQLFHSLPDGHDCGTDNRPNPWTTTRVVSSTSRNLRHEVNEKRFRRDLFYRLAVVTFEVPPLRNRMNDLLIIADHLRLQYSKHFSLPSRAFPDSLVERMRYHDWPGNIHELENFVCRYVILGAEGQVLSLLSPENETAATPSTVSSGGKLLKDVTRRTQENVEREMILRALAQHNGNLKQAAHSLGISYRTLLNKMDNMGLPRVHHAVKRRESLES